MQQKFLTKFNTNENGKNFYSNATQLFKNDTDCILKILLNIAIVILKRERLPLSKNNAGIFILIKQFLIINFCILNTMFFRYDEKPLSN